MKVLLISPLGFAVNSETKYSGIEVLVYNFASELVKNHTVGVMGHADSVFPDGVTIYPTKPLPSEKFLLDELRQYRLYQSIVREYDVVHDFSHQHFISRHMANIPSLNLFWHAPALAQYPKAPYNIIALSQWAKREFERVYRQKARYQYSVCIDTRKYKLSNRHRNNRFYALGRMGAEKGNLEAVMLASELKVPLDIQGARGTEFSKGDPLTDYEKEVLSYCDGKQIKYLGDLPEPEKIKIMQTNKALIYPTNHPEVTSHKDQECLLAGMPVIVSNIGAAPEIVTHGVNGYLCNNAKEFMEAMKNVDKLDPLKVYDETVKRFGIEGVVPAYMKLYEEVANGLRWK